jgi:hypothetical protein
VTAIPQADARPEATPTFLTQGRPYVRVCVAGAPEIGQATKRIFAGGIPELISAGAGYAPDPVCTERPRRLRDRRGFVLCCRQRFDCPEGFGLTSGLAKPNALLEQIWNTLLRYALPLPIRFVAQSGKLPLNPALFYFPRKMFTFFSQRNKKCVRL